MLEDIYNKVYAGTEEIKSADYAISSQLTPLIENADLEGMTREEFVDLLCRAGAIGEGRVRLRSQVSGEADLRCLMLRKKGWKQE